MNLNLPTVIFNKDGNIVFPTLNKTLIATDVSPYSCQQLLSEYQYSIPNEEHMDFIWQAYQVIFEYMPSILSFCFYQSQLFSVHIYVMLPNSSLIAGWPSFESSQREIAFVEKAFAKQFNNTLKYGQPFYYYDRKSASAVCGILYKENSQIKNNDYKFPFSIPTLKKCP